MNSPSTQDSPKVPERPWPELWLQRPTPVADAENYSVWGEASNEAVPHPCDTDESERYIPVSALLSDETKEAARHGYLDALKRGAEPIEAALQAAIEHVGGGQGEG